MSKRVYSVIIVFVLVMLLSGQAFAANATDEETVTCTLTGTESELTLTVSGKGRMTDYSSWQAQKDNIVHIVIEEGVTYISFEAFSGLSNLKTASLPSSLELVETYLFSGCRKLESVDLASGIESIGEGAFRNCSRLQAVTIPDSIGTLGSYAFSGCSKMEAVDLPDGITCIEEGLFSGCVNLRNVTIPDSVKKINSFAFEGCSNLEEIIFNNNIETIGESAFSGCKSLNGVILSDNLTVIDSYAFSGCTNLSCITIPGKVTTINSYAFYECTNLESIVIPSSVTMIGSGAFNLIKEDYTVYAVYDSYAAKKINPRHLSFMHVINDSNDPYLGFISDRIIMTPDGTVSLSDYLKTNRDINNYSIEIADSSLFYYSNGTIAALNKEGETTLTVSCQNMSATARLISSVDTIEATGISFDKSAISMELGDVDIICPHLFPENTTENNLTWQSSDTSVVKVDNGVINAVGKGTAIVTASITGKENICASYDVTVSNPLKEITSPMEIKMRVGCCLKAPYYLYPSNPDEVEVSIVSNDPDVLSIDERGNMHAHKNGNATVNFSARNCRCSTSVTVYTPITAFSIGPGNSVLKCGDTIQLNAVFEPEDATKEKVTWFTVDDSIASVDCNGLVTAKGNGITTITATAGGFYAECTIVCNEHSWDEGRITKAPVCCDNGIRTFTCYCGQTKTEEIQALGHDWESEPTVDSAPDCEREGAQSIHCSRCTEVKDMQTIPALGHVWNEQPTIDKAATCTETGLRSIHCGRCDARQNEEVIPALGHTWNDSPTTEKAPTCTEEGAGSTHCSRCDAIQEGSEKVIPKTDHSFSAWKTTIAATEIAAGQKTRTCSECGQVEKQTIAQLKPTLPAVTITKPAAAKKAATVKWKKVSAKNQKKIAKIEIQYSLDKTFKTGVKTVYGKKNATSKKITKLKSKKTYYIRIRAYKKSGGLVHVSKWSSVKKVKAK